MNRATIDVQRHAPSPIWQSYDTSRNHRWFSASPAAFVPPPPGSQTFQMPSPLQRPHQQQQQQQQQPQRLYHTTTMPSTNPLLNQRSTMVCSTSTTTLLPPPQPLQRRTNGDMMAGPMMGSRLSESAGSLHHHHHSTQLQPPPSRVVLGSPTPNTPPLSPLTSTIQLPPPLPPSASTSHMKINAPIIGLPKTAQVLQREIPSFLSQESAPRPAPIPPTPPPLPSALSTLSTPSVSAAPTAIAFGPLFRGSRKFLLRRLDTQLDCALLIRLDPDCFVAIQCKYTDDKNTLQQRCAAFVKAHNLKAELVLRGLYQKCFTMLKKRERLLAKKMASVVRLLDERQEVKEMYYSIVDIIALME